MARRSWWGWGYEEDSLSGTEVEALRSLVSDRFGRSGSLREVPSLGSLEVSPARLSAPGSLAHLFRADLRSRVSHSYGKSYRDVVRALAGRIEHPPDLVAYPATEKDVEDILDWCSGAGAAVVPYGGGSSVVGGVEPDVGDGYEGSVSLDLAALERVLEVDETSLAARVQAGVLGPSLEQQLRPHGLTLRHFPQSFEFSSLGGWIATRSGGHFAMGPTHIDDLVESLRVLTPAGIVETRRLPASGAGPSAERIFMGSEGTLGVVTEAWMRVRRRPVYRAGGPATFDTFSAGALCARALAQSGLLPSNCRLIDPLEALVNGAGDGTRAVLLIGFESSDHPVEDPARLARELALDHGGLIDEGAWSNSAEADGQPSGRARGAVAGDSRDAQDAWRKAFLRAPYVRDTLVRLGLLCETFETAITWERLDELHEHVSEATRSALGSRAGGGGFLTCRLTHLYPDGAAPYFTVVGPAVDDAETEQWADVKEAASEAVLSAGGTITHHHAVGRDHRPWFERETPPLFAEALRAAKAVLDPTGMCNPGVLWAPAR